MDKDFDLDALFAEAAEVRVQPSAALQARILTDAAKAQPKPQAFVKPVISPKPQPGWFAGMTDVLGGVRSIAGLSMAALVGLYLGVAQPTALQSLTGLLEGTTTVEQMDLLPATGTLWTEE